MDPSISRTIFRTRSSSGVSHQALHSWLNRRPMASQSAFTEPSKSRLSMVATTRPSKNSASSSRTSSSYTTSTGLWRNSGSKVHDNYTMSISLKPPHNFYLVSRVPGALHTLDRQRVYYLYSNFNFVTFPLSILISCILILPSISCQASMI
jgi:hypothetical protein